VRKNAWQKNWYQELKDEGQTEMDANELVEKILSGRVCEYAVIPTSALVFSEDVVKACEANRCGHYNKCWTCPPGVGTLNEQKEKILAYKSACIFTTKYELEDSFDYEGMVKAKDIHNLVVNEAHEKVGETNPVYGAGACRVCETCSYPEPCRFPGKCVSSIEAAGIDVTQLSRAGNIKYNNGPNTVTYFSMVLFR
jgi:predicted metal-binding protein